MLHELAGERESETLIFFSAVLCAFGVAVSFFMGLVGSGGEERWSAWWRGESSYPHLPVLLYQSCSSPQESKSKRAS